MKRCPKCGADLPILQSQSTMETSALEDCDRCRCLVAIYRPSWVPHIVWDPNGLSATAPQGEAMDRLEQATNLLKLPRWRRLEAFDDVCGTARWLISEVQRLRGVASPLEWMAQWRCSEEPECIETAGKLLTHYCKPCYARAILGGRFSEEAAERSAGATPKTPKTVGVEGQ